MRNLLLKARIRSETPATYPSRARVPQNGAHAGFTSPEDFADLLVLERKRVERSHRWILLMLLDLRRVFESQSGQKFISRIESAVLSSTRETDIKGWYRSSQIIGVIFTETGEESKSAVSSAILARITQLLGSTLASDAVERISISLTAFPEEQDADHPGHSIDSQLYPDLFEGPGQKKIARLMKRAMDIAVSVLTLAILSPLFALIACLIKLTSQGPVLFRQERVGQRGLLFKFLKFRSMYVQSDPGVHKKYVHQLITGGNGSGAARGNGPAIYKITRDSRVTSVGRLLRKTSLDELPQLWNVLKGEMSLVGPRPPIPYEFEWYALWHRRRVLEAKPGITGLWQVTGRSRTTFDEMVRLDLQYARQWSLWLDVKILVRTTKAVVSGEGAY